MHHAPGIDQKVWRIHDSLFHYQLAVAFIFLQLIVGSTRYNRTLQPRQAVVIEAGSQGTRGENVHIDIINICRINYSSSSLLGHYLKFSLRNIRNIYLGTFLYNICNEILSYLANPLYRYPLPMKGVRPKRLLGGGLHALVSPESCYRGRISVSSFYVWQACDMFGFHGNIGHVLCIHVHIFRGNVSSAETFYKSAKPTQIGFCLHFGITYENSFAASQVQS